MKHIIGLGNPGDKYIGTRHNVGRDFLLWLAEHESFSTWQTDRYAQAQCAEGNIKGEPMLLALPETFMNKSGETVRYLKDKQSLLPEHCTVVYDDVDLPVGTFKISTDRGSGGHNGVQSVIDGLGSKAFVRVRIGVARTSFWTGGAVRPRGEKLSQHVLGTFTKKEQQTLTELYPKLVEALEVLAVEDVATAMQRFN